MSISSRIGPYGSLVWVTRLGRGLVRAQVLAATEGHLVGSADLAFIAPSLP